jgi:hypothetical protein
MPWTVADVEKHNKGLGDSQKARWVAVANSALKSCMEKGGSESECAASAIRQANGVVANESYPAMYRKQQGGTYVVERKKLHGKDHLVVPVILMVEGVRSGSRGPLLHLIEDLGRYPDSWNGMPVVINHPKKDGAYISANSPEVIEEQAIGKVFNTHVLDNSKLAAQVWLEEERLRKISLEVLKHIEKGKPLEISVGIFNDEEQEPGDYKGEHYDAIARNHRPDHLALLPGSVGACSLVDGCGIRVNTEGQECDNCPQIQFFNFNKKEVTMANDCKPCIKKKVDALIAHESKRWTEEDREFLEGLEEARLDKMTPIVNEVEKIVEKEVEKIVEKEVQVNALTDDDKAALAFGKTQLKEQRETVVKGILANTKDVWTEELLKSKDLEDLKRIRSSIKKEVVTDYSLLGGQSINVNDSKETPLMPPNIKFVTK